LLRAKTPQLQNIYEIHLNGSVAELTEISDTLQLFNDAPAVRDWRQEISLIIPAF